MQLTVYANTVSIYKLNLLVHCYSDLTIDIYELSKEILSRSWDSSDAGKR